MTKLCSFRSLVLGVGMVFAVVLAMGIGLAARADDNDQASSSSASTSTDNAPHLRLRIVVDQGKWDSIKTQQWNLPPEVGAGIQAQLVDKLEKSGHFIVMEREATSMDQQNQEDQIDATKKASIGAAAAPMPARQKRTAANYIITPSVIGFTMTSGNKGGFSIGGLALGQAKQEATLTLNIRISDAQTSEIIDSQTAMGRAQAKASGGAVRLGSAGFNDEQFNASPAGQAVDQALDDAVSQIVARLSKEPWSALIAAKDPVTGRIIINAGDLAGVTTGLTLDVYHASAPVLDPDTGETISAGDKVKVGTIKVVRVEHTAAFCEVVAGKSFLVHDIVQAPQ